MGIRLFAKIILAGVILFISANAFSQSTFIKKGRSASGVSAGLLFAGLNNDKPISVGSFSASFGMSHAGILDIGLGIAKPNDPTNDTMVFSVSTAVYPLRSESSHSTFSAGVGGTVQTSGGDLNVGGGLLISQKIRMSDKVSILLEYSLINYFINRGNAGNIWILTFSLPLIIELSSNSLLFIAPIYHTWEGDATGGCQVGIVWGTNILRSERDAWADG